MRALVFLAPLLLAGCVNWQAGYDNFARRQCAENPDDASMRDCLDRADRNSRDQRYEQRNPGGAGN